MLDTARITQIENRLHEARLHPQAGKSIVAFNAALDLQFLLDALQEKVLEIAGLDERIEQMMAREHESAMVHENDLLTIASLREALEAEQNK